LLDHGRMGVYALPKKILIFDSDTKSPSAFLPPITVHVIYIMCSLCLSFTIPTCILPPSKEYFTYIVNKANRLQVHFQAATFRPEIAHGA
jgi:hypothetical protein